MHISIMNRYTQEVSLSEHLVKSPIFTVNLLQKIRKRKII
jgi:hypothetical protein